MPPTRREFIKQFGVMLASLAMSGCAPWPGRDAEGTPTPTCYVPVEPSPTPPSAGLLTRQAEILTATATSGGADPEATRQALVAITRERLRAAWQQLPDLAAETAAQFEGSDQKLEMLVAEHRAAMDELVDSRELPREVANQVQVAFQAAAYHVWRVNAPITCYEPVLIDYKPVTSDQLVKQSGALAEGEGLDPQTITQAQAAIAKEMAFLNLSSEQVNAWYEEILDRQEAGQPVPQFEDVDLEAAPQDLEAARFLVDLLLDRVP